LFIKLSFNEKKGANGTLGRVSSMLCLSRSENRDNRGLSLAAAPANIFHFIGVAAILFRTLFPGP
jgi:hypothetical protein